MKFYVLTDLEGVAGVARWDQTGADERGYAQAVRLMTAELVACVEGIQSQDPRGEIWVWDAHGCGSIDLERFPRGARLLNNGPVASHIYLDSSFDGLFFLGQHARAGTRNGNLAHSYSSKSIAWIKINGVEMGELGCRAAHAGTLGVPTVFVSGDDAVCAEARELIPTIVTAEVKKGLAPQVALHLAPLDARDVVSEAAARAVRMCRSIEPFVLSGPPYVQVIRIWGRTDPAGFLQRGFEQVDALTFTKTTDDLTELFI